MLGQLLKPEIAEIIESRNFTDLREILIAWNPPDIAELLHDLTPEDRAIIFRILPRDLAGEVFEYLEVEEQEELLNAMRKEEVTAVLNDMSPDDRTTLLEELPGPVAQKFIGFLSPRERKVALDLLNYPEESIGRLMTPYFLAVREHWKVSQVLDHIRRRGHDSDSFDVIYVVDRQGVLVDHISIRDILLSDPEEIVGNLNNRHIVSLSALDDQETAIDTFKKHDLNTLPVTDSTGHILGVVTIDDILDVEEEETTEDIQKIGGMQALEEPYITASVLNMIKKRAGWLMILFVGELLTTTALGYFEHELAKAIILVSFVPLIMASGGNSGSQASTLVIRAISLGEVSLRDWWRIMRREILSGLALGGILGAMGFAWTFIAHSNDTEHTLLVAITISLTLLSIVLWGTLAGSMLPLVMKKLNFDPATSSTPLVATMVDVTGILIYFSIALSLLTGTLL
jgi:magnesium transporter